jgi:flavodoxin
MKTLVAYYSWTGHTRQIAEAIAAELKADLEDILEKRPRSGLFSFLRSLWEVLQVKAVPLKVPVHDVSDYDLIILGTPVWAGRVASPMGSYVDLYRHKFRDIAVFCSEGGANGDKALAQLAQRCGKLARAQLEVTDKDFKSGAYRQQVTDFAGALK